MRIAYNETEKSGEGEDVCRLLLVIDRGIYYLLFGDFRWRPAHRFPVSPIGAH
jgi:hypothetical protein